MNARLIALRPDMTRPLARVEDDVLAVVERLTIVEMAFANNPNGFTPDELRGLERITSDALRDAQAIRAARLVEFQGGRS